MAEKTTKTEKLEREYIIPLREKIRVVPRYKKANKAIRTIKEFLARHMKIRDRDLRKIRIDRYLNDFVWSRGIKNPPHKVKVRAIKESGSAIVRVELSELPEKLRFKKLRAEKVDRKSAEVAEKKKEVAEEPVAKTEESIVKTEEKKEEEKEKKISVVEAGKEMEKIAAKKVKHEVKIKAKEPKHQFRQALKK